MFEIWGITFYLYGFLIGLGVWMAMEIAVANRGKVKKEVLEKVMTWAIIGGVIGARIYHVADFWGRYYSANLNKILYFWEGGLGIWGALVGGVLGVLLFCYFNKLNFLKFIDILIIGMPLAQVIGRIGNYINGEIVGKNGEPLFAYEGALNLILFGLLWKISRKQKKTGFVFGVYLVGYGVIRAVLENLRPTESIWKLLGVPMAVIFSFAAVLVGGYLIFRRKQS
ncbi:MAG: prolipoprotein diacylglyceryl transferase [Microgenomates group bacterium]